MKSFIRFIALMLAVVLANGCSRQPPETKAKAAVPVLAATAVTTNVPVQIEPPPIGHVTPRQTVNVRSQIGGIISAVKFKEGEEVRQGELLFTIDPRPAQAALDQARANLERDAGRLEYSRANYARDQKLLGDKIISEDQLDTDKASLDAATGTVAADKAAITNAILNLSYCRICSPINGRTGNVQFHAGNVVKSPDDILLTINQIHPIDVAFAVPEQYLPEIRRDMRRHTLPVSVTFQDMTGAPPRGRLTFVDNTVDENTGTIMLKATFTNADERLWPGQFVNVTLTLADLKDVVVVPSQAVQTGQDGEFVYVVKSDHTVAARTVTTGLTYHGETVVLKGLKAGETVVTDGQLRLAPGAAVKIRPSLQAAVTAALSARTP